MSDDETFDPQEPLPVAVPVFPLTGALLLPRGLLPLNIFEPRYLAMVKDAIGRDRRCQPHHRHGPAPRHRQAAGAL